jgi:hypothetical protein
MSILPQSFVDNLVKSRTQDGTREVPDTLYKVPTGMPLSVFNDRYSRKINGRQQGFTERVTEMVAGNVSLDIGVTQQEKDDFTAFAVAGITPMSGRHMQHGDVSQKDRNIEVFTNCSTTPFSFLSFYLLLNGSGVGRDYSSESCRVDWDYMPNVRIVLDGGSDDDGDVNKGAHPDWVSAFTEFQSSFESLKEAKHKYDAESEDVRWIKVRDSREGWAEAIAVLETAAFHKNHADSLFIFDFSDIRPSGSPIRGMQNKPAQGPIPLMRAMAKLSTIKGSRMKPWKQALFIDHILASIVVMGMVRRAARIATKAWSDRDVIEFIDIKRGGFLWSANNSILTDEEFWKQARDPKPSHGRRVFEAAVGAAYYDETGEPGFLNTHLLNDNSEDFDDITAENYLNPKYDFKFHTKTFEMIDKTLTAIKRSKFPFIVNPCQPGWAPILTPDGIKQLNEIKIGDLIWSGSKWVEVANKWSTGIKKVYRYRTTSGTFYGTENHRIVQRGVKIEVGDADAIDMSVGGLYVDQDKQFKSPQAVIDGLVIGDGSRHYTSKYKVYLDVGSPEQESDYMNSEVAPLMLGPHPAKLDRARIVDTSVTADELPPLPCRSVPDRYLYSDANTTASFLRGLYSANGSCNGRRVTLKSASKKMVEQVQMMLSSLGIPSYFTTNKSKSIQWDNGEYISKESYDININRSNSAIFANIIGFIQPHKTEALNCMMRDSAPAGKCKTTFDIISVDLVSEEEVFDINVDDEEHVYWTGGVLSSNCGEIVLSKFGGYCVIGDVVLKNSKSKEMSKYAIELTTRALIRTNLMDALYQTEVNRTNRIGVGLTGIFEYAWQQFQLTFVDLISVYEHVFEPSNVQIGQEPNKKAMEFWNHIDELRIVAEKAAREYSEELGVNVPHTVTTIKPSGTISKVMASTEGAHLPPYSFYVRWVICEKNSEKHLDYVSRGYPIKDISHQYHNCVVIGFPTKHPITDIMGPNNVIMADDITAEDQFKWISLLEQFWFGGSKHNNQVSYTLKYDKKKVSHDEYLDIILEWQPKVRCCAVMPFTDESAYAYLPEEKIDEAKYYELMSTIVPVEEEDYSEEELMCDGGACPIEQKIN